MFSKFFPFLQYEILKHNTGIKVIRIDYFANHTCANKTDLRFAAMGEPCSHHGINCIHFKCICLCASGSGEMAC